MSETRDDRTLAMIRMADPQAYLLQELTIPGMTRDSIALTYAFAMREPDRVDWPIVNRAIVNRWSPSGLAYIKTQAWKLQTQTEARQAGQS